MMLLNKVKNIILHVLNKIKNMNTHMARVEYAIAQVTMTQQLHKQKI